MPKTGAFTASCARGAELLRKAALLEDVNAWPDYSGILPSVVRALSYPKLWKKCVDEKLYDLLLVGGSIFQFVESPSESFSFLDSPVLPRSFEDFAAENWGQSWLSEKDADGEMYRMVRDEYEAYVDALDFEKPAVPARYDHSPLQFHPPCHPTAHLHMGFSSDVRIATSRRWSPESFVMFVLRQYYPGSWCRLVNDTSTPLLKAAVRDNLLELEAPDHWHSSQDAEVKLW